MKLYTAARLLKLETRALIHGKYVDAAPGQTFETVDPAIGEVLVKVAARDPATVGLAAKAARTACERD